MRKQTSFRDIQKLSAYLDRQLSKSGQAHLEAKLAEQPELQEILMELRQARTLLHKTPLHRVPRNFILTPKMVGMRPPLPRSVPIFRLASITAAVLLVISFSFSYLAPIVSAPSLAAAPLFSQGGGGCGYDDPADCGDVVMEAPYGIGGGSPETATPEELAAMPIAPEAVDSTTPETTPEESLRAMQQPTQDENIVSPQEPSLDTPPSEKSLDQPQPIMNPFQIGLVLFVIICGISAFLIRQINIQRWRKRL